MKVVFSPDYWKKPANGLVKAVQERLKAILEHPAENGVRDGESLKSLLTQEIAALAPEFPRSSAQHLTMKFTRFEEGQFDCFTLNHRRDNITDTANAWIIYGTGKGFPGGDPAPVSGYFGTIVIEF